MESVEPVANTLAALSDPGRIRIIVALASVPERSVGDLAKALGVKDPTMSQQLAILKLTALVSSRRNGQQVLYRLAPGLSVQAGWLVVRMPQGELRLNIDPSGDDGADVAAATAGRFCGVVRSDPSGSAAATAPTAAAA
jgi:DNA-binding transcriptional ArsR family regulator